MRIRTIKPEFWKSQTIALLSAEAKLLAIALLNYADDEGYFFAHPALIRGELMPFAESHSHIPPLLEDLKEAGYIRIGEDAAKRKIGLVVNFKKHQLVNRPQKSKLAGTVDLPDWSPALPGVLQEPSTPVQLPPPEPSVNNHGSISEDSMNVHGAFTAGMDQGNGKGMEEEGNGGSSPDKPGGTSAAASSMSEAPKSDAKPTDAPPTQPDSSKKKEGGAAGDDLAPAMRRRAQAEATAQKKKGAEPEFPESIDIGHRHALTLWWHYKRERYEGYKPSGWQALIKQQLRFPPEQVLASVEASMANNWAGLFTDKHADAVYPAGKSAAKKEGGAAEPVPHIDREPPGWRDAWKELYPFAPPERWGQVPESNRDDVKAYLRKKGGA
jgi:hypothetical protein